MSTAIPLENVDTSLNKGSAELRQRKASRIDSSQEDDAWLSKPHDIDSSKLPLDANPFMPTSVYWIPPHGMLAKEINILDMTKDMVVPYNGMTDHYKAEIKKILKDHSHTPIATCHRQNWIGLKYNITDDQNKTIAHWSHPWLSAGEAVLTFTADSAHSSHPISLRNKRWGLRTESFTVNSQLFFWEMDSVWHSTNMTLFKVLGTGEHQKKVEVGKYAQKWWGGFLTGGLFVLDDKEMNGLLACLTLVVVLKKKRQRAAERYNGGGQ